MLIPQSKERSFSWRADLATRGALEMQVASPDYICETAISITIADTIVRNNYGSSQSVPLHGHEMILHSQWLDAVGNELLLVIDRGLGQC